MTDKEKNAIKTLLGLYKKDAIKEEALIELLECIVNHPINTYYYPWISSDDNKPLVPQYTTTTVGYAELS